MNFTGGRRGSGEYDFPADSADRRGWDLWFKNTKGGKREVARESARMTANQTEPIELGIWTGIRGTEKTFPRMTRINADQTMLPGLISATISEIRGESDRDF